MFSEAEKTDIRRFCGYPAYGAGPAGFQSWRFYQSFGLLEFRMNNLSASESQVVRGQLAALRALEAAIPAAGETLDTASASVWTRNPDELRERQGLLTAWCRRLCAFFGLPAGPGLASSGLVLVV